MSGHSKWNNIQGRKNAQDSKRSKVFQKLAREIFVAAKKVLIEFKPFAPISYG